MPSCRKGLSFLLALLAISVNPSTLLAQPPLQQGKTFRQAKAKLVLFLMDGVSYRHILPQGLSAFGEMGEWLERNGGMALLNTMGYGGTDRFRAAMTLACGVRAYGDDKAALVLQADEPLDADTALDAYRRRTGLEPRFLPLAPFRTLVFPMLSDLKWSNERLLKKPLPFGVVATSLAEKGIRIVAIGCGDPSLAPLADTLTPNYFRHGLLVALDKNGAGLGLTKGLLKRDTKMPFGLAVDEKRWQEAIIKAWDIADVLVLFPGETFRADLYGSEHLLGRAISRELKLLRLVADYLDIKRDLLLVLPFATPRKSRYEHSFLFAVGEGILPGSLLTSATTHQKGIVSILDIPTTILDFFGVEPADRLNGSPIRSVLNSKLDKEHLFQIAAKAQITDAYLRVATLSVWCVVQALLFLAVALALSGKQSDPVKTRGSLVLYALGWFSILTSLSHLTLGLDNHLAALLTAIIAPPALGIVVRHRDGEALFGLGVLIAVLIFLFDVLTRGKLSLNAPFGYSTFFGGRYYGLGNVGMGLTLGALVAAGLFLNHRGLTVMLSVLGAVLSGVPFWGANVGGALTGTVVAVTAMVSGRFRWWHLLVSVLLVLALFGFFTAVELTRQQPLTHWGRFVQDVTHAGISEALAMVQTKLGITFRAFRSIHWNIALASQILLMVMLRIQMNKARKDGREICQGWQWWTIVIGSIAACLLNDSGPQTPVAFAFLPLCVLSKKSLSDLRDLPSR